MKQLLFACLIISSLFACKSETKPTFDLENAKKEIEVANQNLSDCMAKSDSVGMSNAYTKDGALLLHAMPAVEGRDNIKAFWGSIMKNGIVSIGIKTIELWGNEDVLVEQGLVELKTKDNVVADNGKYLVVWKKEDGKWKLHRDMANSNLPVGTK